MAGGAERAFLCPVLIGRDQAVGTLRRLVDEAAGGEGRAALIEGDAGAGKSRLAAAIRPYAGERGFVIVEGVCFLQDRGEPYAPLVDAVRGRYAGHTPEAVVATLGPFARDLGPLMPDLFPPPDGMPAGAGRGHERRRLFAALAQCLIGPNGQRPVLFIIEDLHWCDEATLDFLFWLARRGTSRPLLIGTYRGEEVTPHLRAWLAQMGRERHVEALQLAPLQREEVRAMVHAILSPRAALPAGLLDAVHALAEGNPFAVEELVKTLPAGDEAATAGDARLPRSLHAAVRQRVERLSPAARDVLQVAAVIGRRFDFGLLLHLSGLGEPALVSLLEELAAAQLVTEESDERLAFRHALTRQAVYTDMLIRTRTLLHRRVAEEAEQRYGTALGQHLGDLAEHFYRAEVWDKAQAYARRAGERALRLYAFRSASQQFTRALEANARLARAAGMEECDSLLLALTAVAAHRGRGRASHLLGDFEGARADHEAAIELARTVRAAQEECRGLLDAGVLWAARDYTRAGRYYRAALDLARGLDEPALLADCLNRLGNWHANVAAPCEAASLLQEALAIVERIGDRRGVATTLDWLGTASYLSRDLPASVDYFERAVAIFRELDDRPALISCLTMLAARGGSYDMLSMEADAADVAAGLRDGEEALALARAIDVPAAEAFAAVQLAAILGPRGEYGRALELAERALHVANEIGHGQWMRAAHGTLGLLYLDLLAPALARPHLERALALAREMSSTYWARQTAAALAIACLELHEPHRAAAVLAELPRAGDPVQPAGWSWETYASARLALVRRDPALALRLCDQRSLSAPAPSPQCDAAVDLRLCDQVPGAGDGDGRTGETPLLVRLRAEVLAALGRIEEAEAALHTARAAMRRQGTRSELWRVHAALGNLYRTAGRAEDARLEFAAARAIIEQIATTIPDPRPREGFLRRATAHLPRAYRLSPSSSTAARFGGLTAREREVATLVARGKSNGEIAEAMVLGRRTVETHVANIFTKIGVASRGEIAAWASTHGLTADVA